MALNIYLIRHGETEWSLTRQHTGRTDIPLTARGEEEARKLAPGLKELSFSRILMSPLKRAQKTCELAGRSSGAIVEPDLIEWNYGNYEGRCSVDIRQQRKGWQIFRDGCPGGETVENVRERADRLLSTLRLLDGNIALFTHGHIGSVLAVRWVGLPLASAQNFPLETTTINILSYDEHHPEVPIISVWNALQTTGA